MYEPLISIVTTTKNIVEHGQADDFNAQIYMLSQQTYENIEHFVVDGASTDETITLLKEYKNSGHITFFSEPDIGKYDAYNKALLRVGGKYVAFISCDDFYHDVTGITDVVNLMEKEDADYCFFPSYCRHPQGYVFLFTPAFLNTFRVCPCPRQAIVFKKSVLDELRGFDEKFKIMADYDLVIRMVLSKYKGVFFDGNIMTCRLGEKTSQLATQVNSETNHIFYKNYKALFPLTDDMLVKMVEISEMPRGLLDKLAESFPAQDKELFLKRYEFMYNMRKNAALDRKNAEKQSAVQKHQPQQTDNAEG